jgi:hypothetical protein
LDPSAVLKLLAQAPTVWEDSDPSKIRTELSNQLDQFKAGLSDYSTEEVDKLLSDLRTAPFLYVEAAETQFRTPTQVVLEGISLGDEFVSISTLYTRHHQFLHEQVGVQQRVQIDDCLDFLADHPKVGFTDEELKAWNQTLEQLLSEFDALDEQDFSDLDALNRLEQEPVVPTHSGTTAQLTDIEYYCFDDTLLEATEQEIGSRIIREPTSENLTQNRLTPLWGVLGLKDLRDAVKLDLVDTIASESAAEPTRIVDDDRLRKLLTVCLSFLEASEEDRDNERGELAALSEYHLEEYTELQGYYSLNEQQISERLPLQSYVDHANGRMLRTAGIESYYNLAARLIDELQLSPKQRDKLGSLLSGAVGTEPDLLQAYLDDHDVDLVPYPEQSIEESGMTVENGSVTKGLADEEELGKGPEATSSESGQSVPQARSELDGSDTGPKPDGAASTKSGLDSEQTPEAFEPTNQSSQTRAGISSGGGSSGGQSTTSSDSGDMGPPPTEQESGDSSSEAQNTDSNTSTFEPEVVPSAVDSQTALENRPASMDHSEGRGNTSRRGARGGGGGGGRTAPKVGLWGEEFVVSSLVDDLRTVLADDQASVSWCWDPTFLELAECARAFDDLDPQSRIAVNRYGVSVPGVKISGPEGVVRVLHIRDVNLGADILIDGGDVTIAEKGSNLLTDIQPSGDAETWVEVKSSVGTMDGFELTIPEYGRAREQQDGYCIITLCQVGSPDMYIDRRLCDIAALSDSEKIILQSDGNIRIDY